MSESELIGGRLAEINCGLRERRALGLTVFGMARVARELKAEGAWPESRREQAAAIAARLVDENPEAGGAAGERDRASFLEALIAFIGKMMPLILIFMGMFGGV